VSSARHDKDGIFRREGAYLWTPKTLRSYWIFAQVSRAKADMAAITTGLEAYAVDNNDYPPNNGTYNVTPVQITTPIKYLTSARPVDPFASQLEHPIYMDEAKHYTYALVVDSPFNQPSPPIEAIDHPLFNPGALDKYGKWYQLSIGPDLLYSGKDSALGVWPTYLFDTPYDPTNGISSFGNIIRTQKQSLVRQVLTR